MTDKAERRERIKGGLRAERNRANITQQELSEMTGFRASTISGWESGDGNIGFDQAYALADIYGISLDQLAGRNTQAVA